MAVTNLSQNRSLFTVKKDKYGNTVLIQATGQNGGDIRGSILKTNTGKPFLVAGKGIKIASGSKGYPDSGQIYIEFDSTSAGLDNLPATTTSSSAVGTKGPRGTTGPQGAPGTAGTNGSNGDDGIGVSSAALDAGTNAITFGMTDGSSLVTNPLTLTGVAVTSVVVGTPGTESTDVTISWDDGSGGSLDALVNLPHGVQGDQGLQGLTGDTGDTGAGGPRGNTGPQGDQGIQGIPGSTGGIGNAGSTGATGDTGISVEGINVVNNHLIFDMSGAVADIDAGLVPNAIGITGITSVNNGPDTTITIEWASGTTVDVIIPHPALVRTKEVVTISTATPAGTTIDIPDSSSPIDFSLYDPSAIDIYVNGVLAAEGANLDYELTSGDLTFTAPLLENDILSVVIQNVT